MDWGGYGKCQKEGVWYSVFSGWFYCYVNQPSSCPDIVNSIDNPGKQLSAEACKDDPSSLGNIFLKSFRYLQYIAQ